MATFGRSFRQNPSAPPQGMGRPPMQQRPPLASMQKLPGGGPNPNMPPQPMDALNPSQALNPYQAQAQTQFDAMNAQKGAVGGMPDAMKAYLPPSLPAPATQAQPPNQMSGLMGAMGGAGAVGMKKGGSVKGAVKKYAKGNSVSSASARGDGCAIRGKTKGKFV